MEAQTVSGRGMAWRAAVLLLGLAVLVSACGGDSDGGDDEVGYEPFPSGYRYLKEGPALERAIKDGDPKVVRRHGWYLWAGIMQPATAEPTWPVWKTWPNTYGAFLIPKGASSGSGTPDAATPAPASPHRTLRERNADNLPVDTEATNYPIPKPVIDAYPSAITYDKDGNANGVKDGATFVSNGDIMIPTESLSSEAFDWIRDNRLYLTKVLTEKQKGETTMLDAPKTHVVTKHMYWPVKKSGFSALPVWHDDFGPKYPGYAGYEYWKQLVAIDPTGKHVGEEVEVTYLFGVQNHDKTPIKPVTRKAKVHSIEEFYHHRVTEADWKSFDTNDKAILNAASRWAYNEAFGPGDYVVTIAMHINTKEIPTWTLQSVWWSDTPNTGPHAADRPDMPQAKGPWAHYLLTVEYGITEPNGALPIRFNPYIELVIHPVATNCRNCHVRSGWPAGKGPGLANYQNSGCEDLLENLTPKSKCFDGLMLTDFQWIIPDRAGPKSP